MSRRLFDVTLPFGLGVPSWPGEPAPRFRRLSDMDKGDACNVTHMDFAVHYGTHLDAPIHFIRDGADVASLALEVLMGPCTVVHLPDSIREIGPKALDALALPEGCRRLLLRTRNSALWDRPDHPFFTDFTAFTPEGAQWLVRRELQLVGVDYLSVQRFADQEPTTHRLLLGAGVVAVEGLDLRGIEPGDYDLACLPLKLVGADGSPCRVVLSRAS